ncbi:MAG: acetolactate synthase small subunit [Actinobacteria bacterium]|nr:acetolactate synthase small subunit [Actinomycetota bacterium]
MAGRILQEDIDALKRRADLADIASDYTRMKKAGSRWKGLCPFHQEKTPSFTVDAQAGLFHCFGCQAGGDLYSFVERVEGLTFTEAVEHVAVELEPDASVGRELQLVKVSADPEQRSHITELAAIFRGNIVDVDHESMTVEASGSPEKLDAMLEMLSPYGVREMVRTGQIAVARGGRSITDGSKLRLQRIV